MDSPGSDWHRRKFQTAAADQLEKVPAELSYLWRFILACLRWKRRMSWGAPLWSEARLLFSATATLRSSIK